MANDSQRDSGDPKNPPLTQLPPGRHGLPRELVRRNQRERLIAGATKAVAERGFAKVTVSDIIRHARVSRRTFYEHFANKEKCLKIACKKPANRGDGQSATPPAKPPAIDGSANLSVSTQARKELIDHHQRERLIAGTTKAVEEQGFARATVSAIIRHAGASRSTFYRHFASKEECIEAAYGASLASLQEREGEQRFGSPAKNLPRELVRGSQRERLVAAAAKAVEERGYASATARDIIRHAGVSSVTFYEYFASRDECLEAARGISLIPKDEPPDRS